MKHLDKFGRIESEELQNLLHKIESLVAPMFTDVDPIEAACISRHLEGTISYLAAKRCVEELIKEENQK